MAATKTTTTTVTELVSTEYIVPMIYQASKDAAVVAQFAQDHDLTRPGMSATVSLPREVSDVSGQTAIDALDQAEGTDTTVNDFETVDTSFSVSEYGIERDITDDAVEDNLLGHNLFHYIFLSGAGDLAIGFDDDLAALMGGFSNTVGTSGSDMTIADMIEAVSTLDNANMNEGGGYVFMLGSNQKFNLMSAASSGTGVLLGQFFSLAQNGQDNPKNYVGDFMTYPVYFSTLTPTANTGADTTGAVFVRGDGARNARSAAIATSTKRMPTPKLQYDAAGRATKVVITMRRGSAENIDDSGVSIITTV